MKDRPSIQWTGAAGNPEEILQFIRKHCSRLETPDAVRIFLEPEDFALTISFKEPKLPSIYVYSGELLVYILEIDRFIPGISVNDAV